MPGLRVCQRSERIHGHQLYPIEIKLTVTPSAGLVLAGSPQVVVGLERALAKPSYHEPTLPRVLLAFLAATTAACQAPDPEPAPGSAGLPVEPAAPSPAIHFVALAGLAA